MLVGVVQSSTVLHFNGLAVQVELLDGSVQLTEVRVHVPEVHAPPFGQLELAVQLTREKQELNLQKDPVGQSEVDEHCL